MTPPKSSRRSKQPAGSRTRSFGGCATCRIRHMKCDEGKPTCLMCKQADIICGGYEKNIIFASEQDDGIERFRQLLFTEEERRQTSRYIVTSIPPRYSLLDLLSQIDDECAIAASNRSADLAIAHGPFGAFRLATSSPSHTIALDESIESPSIFGDVIRDVVSPSAFAFSPGTQEVVDTLLQNSEQDLDLTYSNEMDLRFDRPGFDERLGESSSGAVTGHNGVLVTSTSQQDCSSAPNTETTTSLLLALTGSSNSIPESAVVLLKHYSYAVIGVLSPSKNTKTLWHVLFLPHVKSTLAALSMIETVDHASLSSFFGTLAISAFHLRAVSKSQKWYDEGCQYRQKANTHIRLALETAYNIPKTAKYKSILMAVLTMVQLSMFDGDWKQTECYLLEAEKFIRLRGLHRPKSRKRRLLHHCYAFMRLLHESLFTMTTSSLQRIHVRLAVESSGLIVVGSDSPYFRIASWKNLVQKMLEVKGLEEGENDLHLENPGLFPQTMYPEIYGLPEEWLLMLSQVIRLGNEREPYHEGACRLNLKEFTARAKDLEQCVINWRQHSTPSVAANHHTNGIDKEILQPLLDALHEALIIYFYRRIYDIDASMLQEKVAKVCESLTKCDEADPRRIRYTSVFVWPAFVAACEAERQETQSLFTAWFEDCVSQSGQSSFEHMFTIVRQVWTERSRSANSRLTWLDFMENSNIIR